MQFLELGKPFARTPLWCCIFFFAGLVKPVRGNTRLRYAIHVTRANLNFERQAFWAEQR